MKFLECDLEEIIYNSDKELLNERGLRVDGKLFRQLRIGNYGIADLVSVNRNCMIHNGRSYHNVYITVYELKKDKIGISAFLQALGYINGISRYLEHIGFKYDVYYEIVLIGRTIDTNSTYSYLTDFILNDDGSNFLSNYTYTYDIDGIKFKHHLDYKLINEGF